MKAKWFQVSPPKVPVERDGEIVWVDWDAAKQELEPKIISAAFMAINTIKLFYVAKKHEARLVVWFDEKTNTIQVRVRNKEKTFVIAEGPTFERAMNNAYTVAKSLDTARSGNAAIWKGPRRKYTKRAMQTVQDKDGIKGT
jgi:hypothetical protein